MSDYDTVKTSLGTSVVRTVVPLVVGAVVAGLAKANLHIDQTALEQLIGAVVATVYYGVVRLAEEHLSPAVGWFLGWAKAPRYTQAPAGTPTPPALSAPSAAPDLPVAGSAEDDLKPLDQP
jgi:hypothetical protein